jgi:hypothetical protein
LITARHNFKIGENKTFIDVDINLLKERLDSIEIKKDKISLIGKIDKLLFYDEKYDLLVFSIRELAYYPPYHSKYNPIERVWGVLEKHWNGTLLDSVSKVIGFAKSMTYNGTSPIVTLVDKVYCTGVKLSKLEMEEVESKIVRLVGLEKWSVSVPCLTL